MSSSIIEKLQEAIAVITGHSDRLQQTDYTKLEQLCQDALGSWSRTFHEILQQKYPAAQSKDLAVQFTDAFSIAFREAHSPANAIADIEAILELFNSGLPVVINFVEQEGEEQASHYYLSMYHEGEPLSPSRLLGIVENLGLTPVSDQHFTCHVKHPDGVRTVHIHDFPIKMDADSWARLQSRPKIFEEAVQAIWQDREGNDRLNSLLYLAELNLREVKLFRAIGRYLMQTRLPYSQGYLVELLVRHASAAKMMAGYFHARFHSAEQDDAMVKHILEQVDVYISQVKSLDEDRVLRRVFGVLQAMLRTNFYQRDSEGQYKPQLSFKLSSAAILDLPKPLPLYETFIYSHRVEGIHLRSSKVARGGIRWSDRREDFRDEVLDLMKAQTVKNSVIVPSGAKGGFYVKRPPANGSRADIQAEAITCYQMFVRGLLDITDNWVEGKIIKPKDVVCYDDDDPYLVVAADKGTASFSDIANKLAQEYGFWLDDAFASGGSAGYDHKKMAITARGAWESVRHHGYQLGINVDAEPITVIGVGDMGGDVFGNGLLRSPHLKLIAAFSYSHIFCDPNPDPAQSFVERQRLFNAAANWDQYDLEKLSPGGRIYSRADKTIELTPEIQNCFGLKSSQVAPGELMRAILCAKADLLWFGGIGTYVKATTEQDSDARDKANDFIRINANELQCRIIGEGANLGMTQRARIEAARAGIALNTDFIDNSAGVNSSDYEVNIKILLNQLMARGEFTREERNQLLVQMTEDVAAHVLNNNSMQNTALGVIESMSASRVEHFERVVEELEYSNEIDRKQDALPSSTDLRRLMVEHQGITRPELSVVMSHTKLLITHKLAQDPWMHDAVFRPLLQSYFPDILVKKYPDAIDNHPLRADLLAMLLSNRMVNQVSPYMPKWLKDRIGLGYGEITRAFWVCSELYDFNRHWIKTYDAPNLSAAVWQDLLIELLQHMDRTLPWFLNQPDLLGDMSGTITKFRPHFETIEKNILLILPPQRRYFRDTHEQRLLAAGVSPQLASFHADLRSHAASPGIVAMALDLELPVLDVARIYFMIGERFGFDALREQARQSMGNDYWERQATSALIEEFSAHQLRMTQLVALAKTDLAQWETTSPQMVGRLDALMSELRSQPKASVTQLTVANRRLRGLLPGTR